MSPHPGTLAEFVEALAPFFKGRPLENEIPPLLVRRALHRAAPIYDSAGRMNEYRDKRFGRDGRLSHICEGAAQIQQLITTRNPIREAVG